MMRAVSRQPSLTIQFLQSLPGQQPGGGICYWLGEVRAGMLWFDRKTLNCLVTWIPWR
jgi:hypothetical protein